MAKKQFTVTVPAVPEQTFEIEASKPEGARNKAIRQWREEHKTPENVEVIRTKAGVAATGADDQAAPAGEEETEEDDEDEEEDQE